MAKVDLDDTIAHLRDSGLKRVMDNTPGEMSVLRTRPDLEERTCYVCPKTGLIAKYCRLKELTIIL